MEAGALAAESAPEDGAELLHLAMSDPRAAMIRARQILASGPAPGRASVAHQTVGIVLRDTGDVTEAVREFRTAVRLARLAGSRGREADVLGSLGPALVYAGRTKRGLAVLDRAVELSGGALLGQVLQRRGAMLWFLGRYQSALADLREAVRALEGADRIWTARTLNIRGLVHLDVGSPDRADADFVAAGQLLAGEGHDLEVAHTVLNRGAAAFLSGDLPAALAFFDAAAERYQPLGFPTASLSQARCFVLLAAGLAMDALAEADAAAREIEQSRGWSNRRAELLLVAARCALAAGQPEASLGRASAAHRLFRAQQSDWWQRHARLAVLQAQYALGPTSGRQLRAAQVIAGQLESLGSAESAQAHLLAGRIALDLGRSGAAEQHLALAARGRGRGAAMSRVTGWLAEALRADAAGEPRRLLAACRRGLDVLDEHRWTLGASELRALASAQGAELATLALRRAAEARDPRLLLTWSERWRAAALAVPPVRPPADTDFAGQLAALRQVTSRLEDARRQGSPTTALEREQLRLEKAVRAASLRSRGTAAPAHTAIDIAELLEALGDTQLVEIVDLDGTLHVLVCGGGRVRRFTAGRTQDAIRAVGFARFALRRLARDRSGDDLASAAAVLTTAGPEIAEAVLGPAAAALRDGPVVVVPPGRLHTMPWAVLPALACRVFSVAPSASAWLRAARAAPPERRRVVLARGPGLVTDGAEVPLVAKLYDDVTALSGADATARAVLTALDGAWLGHIAAHGSFRADSPMFSSLRLADGPLTVYDFEQLDRAPYRLVLPSCDSGVLAPVGADELLGLVSSLLPLGTAGIVAGVVPINDRAVVPLMVNLHEHLRAGQSLAEAMHGVRGQATGDPIQQGAAVSLLALGAG